MFFVWWDLKVKVVFCFFLLGMLERREYEVFLVFFFFGI